MKIDTSPAEAVPGVLGVFTARDLGAPGLDPTARSRAPLAADRVLFVGHPAVAVAAETAAIAEDAASLVHVEHEPLAVAIDVVEAARKGAPRVRGADGATGEEELAMHGAATGGQRLQEDIGPNVVSTQHFRRGTSPAASPRRTPWSSAGTPPRWCTRDISSPGPRWRASIPWAR